MFAQAPRWSLDVDDDGGVQEAVQAGGRDDGVTPEELGPGRQTRLVVTVVAARSS